MFILGGVRERKNFMHTRGKLWGKNEDFLSVWVHGDQYVTLPR
jgi:hypothetical protein